MLELKVCPLPKIKSSVPLSALIPVCAGALAQDWVYFVGLSSGLRRQGVGERDDKVTVPLERCHQSRGLPGICIQEFPHEPVSSARNRRDLHFLVSQMGWAGQEGWGLEILLPPWGTGGISCQGGPLSLLPGLQDMDLCSCLRLVAMLRPNLT